MFGPMRQTNRLFRQLEQMGCKLSSVIHKNNYYNPPQIRTISSARLVVEKKTDTSSFDNCPAKENLSFGKTLSDHMLMIDWDINNKWSAPRIVPCEDIKISPAASSLHYGLQCFEGMKAYKSLKSNAKDILFFRPDLNMKRMASSMGRLSLPGADFDQDELFQCIAELVKLDEKWIPDGEGYSLYIRPTVIATNPFLGLSAPDHLLLYVITSPVGPYYTSGFNPVRLTADTPYVRAWPGGTGHYKVGGNYAPTIKAQADAQAKGYEQVLWLFGDDKAITEVGSMNVFFFLINKDTGRKELVTAPLTNGDILPGVTRDSILQLTRSWGDFDVSERFPTMPEIQDAANDGRLIEAFGAGTAAVVSPISCIQYNGQDIQVPATGDLTQRIWDEITGIQYGKIDGPEGWVVKINGET